MPNRLAGASFKCKGKGLLLIGERGKTQMLRLLNSAEKQILVSMKLWRREFMLAFLSYFKLQKFWLEWVITPSLLPSFHPSLPPSSLPLSLQVQIFILPLSCIWNWISDFVQDRPVFYHWTHTQLLLTMYFETGPYSVAHPGFKLEDLLLQPPKQLKVQPWATRPVKVRVLLCIIHMIPENPGRSRLNTQFLFFPASSALYSDWYLRIWYNYYLWCYFGLKVMLSPTVLFQHCIK